MIKDLLNLTHCILPQAARMRDGAAVRAILEEAVLRLLQKTLEPLRLIEGGRDRSDAGGHQA